MSKVHELIASEAEAAENAPDTEELPEHVSVTRPGRNRSTVLSVRLNPDEIDRLQKHADNRNLPMSTVVRAWILDRLNADEPERDTSQQRAEKSELEEVKARLDQLERKINAA